VARALLRPMIKEIVVLKKEQRKINTIIYIKGRSQPLEDRKHRKGIAVEGFILLALVAVYFVISYEQ
jgi:hypothetical protein